MAEDKKGEIKTITKTTNKKEEKDFKKPGIEGTKGIVTGQDVLRIFKEKGIK